MALERKIRFGLPKGNLNRWEENRGCTKLLFDLAGYKIEGYEPRKEKDLPIIAELSDFLDFEVMSPKDMFRLLDIGALDCGIMGRDTVLEEYSRIFQNQKETGSLRPFFMDPGLIYHFIRDKKIFDLFPMAPADMTISHDLTMNHRESQWNALFENLLFMSGEKVSGRVEEKGGARLFKLEDLGYGRVNVLWGIPSNTTSVLDYLKKLQDGCFINVSSHYPNLAFMDLSKHIPTMHIQMMGQYPRDKGLYSVRVIPTVSTERTIRLGLADLIMDNVSSGNTFSENKLIPLDPPLIKNSSACIYLSTAFGENYYLNAFHGRMNSNLSLIHEFINRLKAASLEYGKTRPDSVHYRRVKS